MQFYVLLKLYLMNGLFPCKILTEISPRSCRDLGENLGEFLAGEISRSQRDLGEISARSRRDLEISPAKNSPRFSPRSQRDLAGQKLAEILAENLGEFLAGQISRSRRDLVEILKSRWPKTRRERFELRSRRDSRRDSHRNIKKLTRRETGSILPRYQNVITRRYHINFIERNNSSRQNKHTEIRLHYVKNNQIY